MKHLPKIGLLACCVFAATVLSAQKTVAYIDRDALYKQGLELFDKKQYASAQKNFIEFAAATKVALLKGDATYYAAACGIELFNKDSEWLMKQFIEKYPASTKITMLTCTWAGPISAKKNIPKHWSTSRK